MDRNKQLTGDEKDAYIAEHFSEVNQHAAVAAYSNGAAPGWNGTHNTQDLSNFGNRELEETENLLREYRNTPDWLSGKVAVEFNPMSGCVFLVDEDYNTGMMNGDDLEQWHNCPECGEEGFLEDIVEIGKDCCLDWLEEAGYIDEDERFTAKIKEGETSHGSLKLEDIVAGIEDYITQDLRDEFDSYEANDEDDEAARQGIFEEIIDHIDNVTPEGLYFGATDGDGSCFGFWKNPEEDEDDEEEETTVEIVRGPVAPPGSGAKEIRDTVDDYIPQDLRDRFDRKTIELSQVFEEIVTYLNEIIAPKHLRFGAIEIDGKPCFGFWKHQED